MHVGRSVEARRKLLRLFQLLEVQTLDELQAARCKKLSSHFSHAQDNLAGPVAEAKSRLPIVPLEIHTAKQQVTPSMIMDTPPPSFSGSPCREQHLAWRRAGGSAEVPLAKYLVSCRWRTPPPRPATHWLRPRSKSFSFQAGTSSALDIMQGLSARQMEVCAKGLIWLRACAYQFSCSQGDLPWWARPCDERPWRRARRQLSPHAGARGLAQWTWVASGDGENKRCFHRSERGGCVNYTIGLGGDGGRHD